MRHVDIARAAGLSNRQLSNVVGDLLDSGWIARRKADDNLSRWVYTVRLGPYSDRMCSAPDLARLLEIIHPF